MKPVGGLRRVATVVLLLALPALAQTAIAQEGASPKQDPVLPALAQEAPSSNDPQSAREGRLPPPFMQGLHPARIEQLPDLSAAPVYRLAWILESDSQLSAHQEVRVTNYSDEPWNELYFLLLPNRVGGRMTVENLLLNGQPVTPRFDGENVVLGIDLTTPLLPGDAAVVVLDYRLEIPESGGVNYGILAFDDGVLSLAHAYALLAVYDDEGWDIDLPPRYGDLVYAFSSFFRVSVDAPADIGVAASGQLIEWDLEGGRQLLEFAAGPVRDFYLATGEEWEQIVRVQNGVTVRGYALPGTRGLMERAVEAAVRSLELFGDLYGHYPFRELDVVPITTSALGVEFPGVIALRRELIEEDQRILRESTVVHEVAHQWFYSLVGNDQVSEPWLDESVTQYLTMRYYLEVYGERGQRLFRQDLLERWEQIGRNRIPIGLPVESYSGSEYGAIIYGLGPLVVERLREMMGGVAFDEFMHAYTAHNAFEVATTSEFRELAEAHCDCSLEEFFEEWVVPRPAAP